MSQPKKRRLNGQAWRDIGHEALCPVSLGDVSGIYLQPASVAHRGLRELRQRRESVGAVAAIRMKTLCLCC